MIEEIIIPLGIALGFGASICILGLFYIMYRNSMFYKKKDTHNKSEAGEWTNYYLDLSLHVLEWQ